MCSKSVSKMILVIFNTIFFILGALVVAIGIFVLVDKNSLLKALTKIPGAGESVTEAQAATSFLESAAIVMIVAGSIVFIIGFCGCCGAIKESRCLLLIYAILVFVILAVQIAAGVVTYFYKDMVDQHLTKFLDLTIADHYKGATFDKNGKLSESVDALSAAWDFAMASMECCGNKAYTDFQKATKWDRKYTTTVGGASVTFDAKVPVTCCKMKDPSVFPGSMDKVEFVNLQACLTTASSASTNHDPCYAKVWELLKQYSNIAMGVAIGVACVEVFGIFAAICLYRAIGKDEYA